jgi:hypothetical protein
MTIERLAAMARLLPADDANEPPARRSCPSLSQVASELLHLPKYGCVSQPAASLRDFPATPRFGMDNPG